MRTVVCHACGADIPDDAFECPACVVDTEGPTSIQPSAPPSQSAPTDEVRVPAVPVEPMRARIPSAAPTNPYGVDDDE